MASFAVVFDLDGTLLDTLDDLFGSVNAALAAHSLPLRTKEEVRAFVGNGVAKLIERCLPGGIDHPQFSSVLSAFKSHYAAHCELHTAPYPGVIELLEKLQAEQIPTAVVSNKFDAAVKQLCAHYFGSLIPIAIGEKEGVRKKPAPDTVLEALREMGVAPCHAIYVGDSEVDIQTAKNAGLPCISVDWGFKDRAFLCQNGADKIVSDPASLYDMIVTEGQSISV